MEKALFAEFPPITDEQWQKLVLKDLKGAGPETLEWNSHEGITVAPYYRANDTPLLAVPKRPAGEWLIRQDIDAADAVAANLQALDSLQRGATALLFMCKADTNVEVLLKDVLIEHIQTDWLLNDTSTLDKLVALINARGIDAAEIKGAVQFNPYDTLSYFNHFHKLLPGFRLFTIEPANAETLTEQTALQLKAANDIIATLTSAGIAPAEGLLKIKFDVAVGTDYFFEIARIRVLRALWAVICQQYLPGYAAPAFVHATNKKALTEKDGYYEMIRQTTQALSAIMGGVDSLSIVPHLATPDRSETFQTRIARNVQLILQHESHLDTVSDPAAGSYYIESITSQLATNTWERFVQLTQAI
jgi:methylmalonyl-CoA mutase